MIYSAYALRDTIDIAHYNCWMVFVKSCFICQPIISKNDVKLGQSVMIELCKLFERLYSTESCIPNMHMACHLQECILYVGPLQKFWCYPYERYNGVLESFNKSWMQPEKQLFKKFFFFFLFFLNKTNFFLSVKDLIASSTGSSSFSQSLWGTNVAKSMMQNVFGSVSLIDAEKKDYHILFPPYKKGMMNYIINIIFKMSTNIYTPKTM